MNRDLFDMLRCPVSGAPLVADDDALVSTDARTRRRYRVDGDVPILLVEESEQLDRERWDALMQRHEQRRDQRRSKSSEREASEHEEELSE